MKDTFGSTGQWFIQDEWLPIKKSFRRKKVSDTFSAFRLLIRPGLSGSNARIDTGADTSATLGSASEWITMKRCNFTFVAKQDSL